MRDCPDDEAWLAFLVHEHAEPNAIDAHLAECADCRALVVALAAEDPPAPAPASNDTERDAHTPRRDEAVAETRPPGTLVAGKWRIEALIGEGGMGRVYRARHQNGHFVALKFLSPALAGRADVVRRFRREGYLANRVAHPAVVKVLDDGDDGGPFLVMELLEGRSCRARIREEGPFTAKRAVRIVAEAARALAEAHRTGVIHRDVKPDNLFLTTSLAVRVLDFGLAAVRGPLSDESLTADGVTMGTVGYMAPEQARGDNAEVGPRSDVWSLAATCVSLVSGRTLLGGRTPAEQLAFAVTKRAPPVATLGLGFSRAVEDVLDRALAFDPAERYADAGAFADALESAVHRSTDAASSRGSAAELGAETPPPPRRRAPWIVGGAGVLAGVGLFAFARAPSPPAGGGLPGAPVSVPAEASVSSAPARVSDSLPRSSSTTSRDEPSPPVPATPIVSSTRSAPPVPELAVSRAASGAVAPRAGASAPRGPGPTTPSSPPSGHPLEQPAPSARDPLGPRL